MHDIVGDRLKKQIKSRRRDRLHYIFLYSFLGVNIPYIVYELIKRTI